MSRYRIAEVRKRLGWTQGQLAERAGLTQQQISLYEQDKRDPKGSVIIALCRALGVSASYLLGMTSNPSSTQPDSFPRTPLLGTIAAGSPIQMEAGDNLFPIPDVMLNRYPQAFLLRVEGESMNRILPNGCYALIDPCTSIDYDGQPYAVRVGDLDATIKCVYKHAGSLELAPDSTDSSYVSQHFTEDTPDAQTLSIIGRVVWHCIPYDWTY